MMDARAYLATGARIGPSTRIEDERSVAHRTSLETQRVLAIALPAAALGAIAFGAMAIGALAIGRLAIRSAHIRRLEIDELVVGKRTDG